MAATKRSIPKHPVAQAEQAQDLKASATNAAELLSHPGTFRFPLVLQEPLESYDRGLKLNVSCAAMGETGPCASSDGETSGGLDGFPCRQVP